MTMTSEPELWRLVMAERFSTVDERRYVTVAESAFAVGDDEDA